VLWNRARGRRIIERGRNGSRGDDPQSS
jgi:hypothetical protein